MCLGEKKAEMSGKGTMFFYLQNAVVVNLTGLATFVPINLYSLYFCLFCCCHNVVRTAYFPEFVHSFLQPYRRALGFWWLGVISS